jgi:mRNA interferase MazF
LTETFCQGEVWWAELPTPAGSTAGYRRPIIIIQGDRVTRSNIATIVCIPLTSNIGWPRLPNNFLLSAAHTGLPRESVAQTTNILTVEKSALIERVGQIGQRRMETLFQRLDMTLGRDGN